MCICESDFLAAKKLLVSAHKIIIISHCGPDGDTIGANLALRRALKTQWNKEIVSACIDPPPQNCDFLPEVNRFVRDFDQNWADVIVVVDAGASYMTKFHESKPGLFSGNPPVINIDHHASNGKYGQINLVEDSAASTTQIIHRFLAFCGLKIDRHIATCLLNGLYYDTGSFMHSNTSPAALEVASELLWKGADFKTIVRKQFHTMPVKQLRLYGTIFERMRVNSRKMTLSALSSGDFDQMSADPDDTTGAIDYLNSVPDGNFCCLIHEDRKGVLKGSLRSRVDDIDLSQIAGIFGGGGHKKAAGFSVPGRLREIAPQIKINGK